MFHLRCILFFSHNSLACGFGIPIESTPNASSTKTAHSAKPQTASTTKTARSAKLQTASTTETAHSAGPSGSYDYVVRSLSKLSISKPNLKVFVKETSTVANPESYEESFFSCDYDENANKLTIVSNNVAKSSRTQC